MSSYPPGIKKIWELETLLHSIRGRSDKEAERKMLFAKLDALDRLVRNGYNKKP